MTNEIALQDRPFQPMNKIARLNRDIIITEKIDGTNASIHIGDDFQTFRVASRSRWITPGDDNMGFAKWAYEHKDALLTLGPGSHFGEWWGQGIQRRYDMTFKAFSLFNVTRWHNALPDATAGIVYVVPTLYTGPFNTDSIKAAMDELRTGGSHASRGFMDAEGVVIYHKASGQLFKATLKNDEKHKGEQ